ncbi:putative atp synthase regulation protein nca2 [Erysiphe necator]|uniref:Putative atp synthase regulation protein nca2 n=1 Tax=Uncinula necator TaxID=52586 RepID=A0A0B1P0L8_UNCNE|nr:putative atp synthase regulation protein nca2 [Erysiphe necator]
MSYIVDKVRYVNNQLDQVDVLPGGIHEDLFDQSLGIISSSRILELQNIIKELSITSSSSILKPSRILNLLERANLSDSLIENRGQDLVNLCENELQWLLVAKATSQTYGLLLEALLEHMIPISDHTKYWDNVLDSYSYSSLFAIQTSPIRLWSWLKDIYHDTVNRFHQKTKESPETLSLREFRSKFLTCWREFYSLMKKSIQKKSLEGLQRRILSPISLCQSEARQNLSQLKRLHEMCASGLGILIVEGLVFEMEDLNSKQKDFIKWKSVVAQSIALMDIVFKNLLLLETGISKFEDTVFESLRGEPVSQLGKEDKAQVVNPVGLSKRLQYILRVLIPEYKSCSQKLIRVYGQPSRISRFWLPSFALLISFATILEFGLQKRELITLFIRDFGTTIRDFCINWLLEPVKKVISTIRHDPESELALMSKESLSGDRDSLERMVIDFAIDNHKTAGLDSSLSESQISNLKLMIREGNLTPVLRAYEKELKNPLIGTIWGDLLRTLLIQIQKSKVDLEIALNGIDALLKSQELVFGFVGLTPGVLICFAVFRYISEVIKNMRGLKQGQKAGQTMRTLRNIDRILTVATPVKSNQLSYKDYGLLLREAHVLRKYAHRLFPGNVEREFLEDITDLCEIRLGIRAQLKALKRIRWGYVKWFH